MARPATPPRCSDSRGGRDCGELRPRVSPAPGAGRLSRVRLKRPGPGGHEGRRSLIGSAVHLNSSAGHTPPGCPGSLRETDAWTRQCSQEGRLLPGEVGERGGLLEWTLVPAESSPGPRPLTVRTHPACSPLHPLTPPALSSACLLSVGQLWSPRPAQASDGGWTGNDWGTCGCRNKAGLLGPEAATAEMTNQPESPNRQFPERHGEKSDTSLSCL
ncbi:unnamed protein product [Rangifer tarandus platyrhynchus]|uniref:Uncharacterized protein n=1 Tax=Rangifer tarandus platyrhynchus TaxID=3082113 RepID=A0AC59ZSE9_RANTA